jgi:selenide,water dikinase
VPLTALSHGAGCGCKLPAALVHEVVRELPRSRDPAALIGPDTADDAGVFRLSQDLALVQSVDFYADSFAGFDGSVPAARRRLLTDPMTSGGVLVAPEPRRADALPGTVVGRLVEGPAGTIRIRGAAG